MHRLRVPAHQDVLVHRCITPRFAHVDVGGRAQPDGEKLAPELPPDVELVDLREGVGAAGAHLEQRREVEDADLQPDTEVGHSAADVNEEEEGQLAVHGIGVREVMVGLARVGDCVHRPGEVVLNASGLAQQAAFLQSCHVDREKDNVIRHGKHHEQRGGHENPCPLEEAVRMDEPSLQTGISDAKYEP